MIRLQNLTRLIVLCPFTIAVSFCQVFTASLSGVVTDPSGGGIPGATVHIRNLETNDARELQSEPDGRYTFSQLRPGAW